MRFSFSLASTFIIVQEYDNIVLLYGCFDKYLFQKKRGKLDTNIQKASELWISWLTYDCEKYSINLYNYCKNNPAIFTDRLGLFIEEEYPQYAVDFIAEIAEGLKNYGRGGAGR